MKKLILGFVLCLTGAVGHAQDFYVGLTTSGANFWMSLPQLPARMLGASCLNYDWVYASDPQGKIKIDNGNFFGFKAKDLFNNFSYGLIIGYQPTYSPFGVYGKAAYKYRQFRMQPDRTLEGMEKYQVPSWTAGVGVRVTPFIPLLEDGKLAPIIDIGTNYNRAFAVRAPYGNDASQFGSGFSTNFGIGVRQIVDSDWGVSIMLNFEMSQYNYFDQDFTLTDGTQPYADIKSKYYSVGISTFVEF